MRRANLIGLALWAQFCPSSLEAAPDQWQPITRADLAGTTDLRFRSSNSLDLRTAGDFNGDGRFDSASVLRNSDASRFRISVCLSRPSGDCVEQTIRSGPFFEAVRLGIETFTEEQVEGFLRRSERGPALRASMRRSAAREFLHVFTYEAGSIAYVWLDGRFQPVGVMDLAAGLGRLPHPLPLPPERRVEPVRLRFRLGGVEVLHLQRAHRGGAGGVGDQGGEAERALDRAARDAHRL